MAFYAVPKGTCLFSEPSHCPSLGSGATASLCHCHVTPRLCPEVWGPTAAQPSAPAAQLPSPLVEWFSQAHTAGPPWNTCLGVSTKLAWEVSKRMGELCTVGSGQRHLRPGWFCFSWKAVPHLQGRLVLQPINNLWWYFEFCFFLFLVRGKPALMYWKVHWCTEKEAKSLLEELSGTRWDERTQGILISGGIVLGELKAVRIQESLQTEIRHVV